MLGRHKGAGVQQTHHESSRPTPVALSDFGNTRASVAPLEHGGKPIRVTVDQHIVPADVDRESGRGPAHGPGEKRT